MKYLLSIVTAVALAACAGKDQAQPAAAEPTTPMPTPVPEVAPADEGRVCCESFGYGAQMVKCCESYEWTTADACQVAPGHVGGGKQVVDDAQCAD